MTAFSSISVELFSEYCQNFKLSFKSCSNMSFCTSVKVQLTLVSKKGSQDSLNKFRNFGIFGYSLRSQFPKYLGTFSIQKIQTISARNRLRLRSRAWHYRSSIGTFGKRLTDSYFMLCYQQWWRAFVRQELDEIFDINGLEEVHSATVVFLKTNNGRTARM